MTPYLLTVCDLSISERSSTHREGRTQHGLADFPARNRVPVPYDKTFNYLLSPPGCPASSLNRGFGHRYFEVLAKTFKYVYVSLILCD